jgi:hypothetical protein
MLLNFYDGGNFSKRAAKILKEGCLKQTGPFS